MKPLTLPPDVVEFATQLGQRWPGHPRDAADVITLAILKGLILIDSSIEQADAHQAQGGGDDSA
jgi:hypothetical protein